MSQERSEILEGLGPARRFADPAGPVEGRLMAASGALPIPPPQLVAVLFALTLDPEPSVAARATESLRGLPDRVADTALASKLHPAALAALADLYKDNGTRLEKIALNPATSDETCCVLAALHYPRVVEILAQNQVRILRCEKMVEALGENPLTGMATIDRILHFLGVERGEHEEPEPEKQSEVPAPPPPDANPDAPPPLDLSDASDIPAELVVEEEEELAEEEKAERSKNIMARIGKMTIMEKMKLARFGNTDARNLLVRDRNKLVAAAAIRNPRSPRARSRILHARASSRTRSSGSSRTTASGRGATR